ncbi:hypothetical protein [Pedobacter cryoconitis]|uniref:Uncharacterized protein n=1 Tax=Pedobacter cryoconitis TaxID=188932 RepID=A0A7X0J5H4_9SPHI|nr:hypothetical protein [Pedobacter cryoconitis]MBB6501024.1 hypothetical protein [Pedobacter cryoconitis]
MTKFRIPLIIVSLLVLIAAIWAVLRTRPEKVAQIKKTDSFLRPDLKKDSLVTRNDTIAEPGFDLFRQKPSLLSLTAVEKMIREKLPELDLNQRYKLLDQWRKVLTPVISHLDARQGQLLPVYENTENNYVEGESMDASKKRVEAGFLEKLSPEQKDLFQQLSAHYIEIRSEEEVGPVFHLRPAYWEWLFASSLTKDDQKFWAQTVLENDPVVDYDAGLAVDRATLGDWAFSWEQYLKHSPKGYYKAEAKSNYQTYMSYLLGGLENTPSTDPDTNKLQPDVEETFDQLIKKYPASAVARSVISFKEKLRGAEGKKNIDLYKLVKSSIVSD